VGLGLKRRVPSWSTPAATPSGDEDVIGVLDLSRRQAIDHRDPTSAKDRVFLAWQADGVAPALSFEVSPTPLARTEVIGVTASISTNARK